MLTFLCNLATGKNESKFRSVQDLCESWEHGTKKKMWTEKYEIENHKKKKL
jgi:hypothetical protein